jgi:hypothetical protein
MKGTIDMKEQYDERYVFIPRVEDSLLGALASAEEQAVYLRELADRILMPSPSDRLGCDSDLKVTVAETEEGWLYASLPVILPKRKEMDRARFLVRPLEYAIIDYFQDRPRPRFQTCVLVYEHIYDHKKRRFIDHDNLELKHCQDVMESFFLKNDGASLCSAFQCSHRGETSGTNIWILQPEEFPAWLERYSEYWRDTENWEGLRVEKWPK